MIIATAPYVAGYRVTETRGQVFGLVVRSRGLGGNLVAGLRSIVGGEIHEYTSLLEDTRRQAIDRMVQNATLVGRTAIISMRFDSLGARRDDVRDRGLRDRGGRSCPTRGRGASPAPAPPVAAAGRVARGRHARPGPDRRRIGVLLMLGRHRGGRGHGAGRVAVLGAVAVRAGGIMVVAVLLERTRYRSLHAERTGDGVGPGGGEPGAPEPRFRPSDERFVDPTTGRPDAGLARSRRPASGGTSRRAEVRARVSSLAAPPRCCQGIARGAPEAVGSMLRSHRSQARCRP